MHGPSVSLWRMNREALLTGFLVGGAFGAFLAYTGEPWWIVPVFVLFGVFPLTGAAMVFGWRVRSTMETFVEIVGRRPNVDYEGFSEATLTWPDRSIELRADAYRGTWWRLYREDPGEVQAIQQGRIEEVAFETLGLLDEGEPDGEPWQGDIDGPLHAGSVAGVLLAGVTFAGLGLLVLPELYALAVGAVAAAIAATLTIWGALWMRRALDDLLHRWQDEGHVVGRPRLCHAGIQPRWALWVGHRFVRIEGLVLGPWSRFTVHEPDRIRQKRYHGRWEPVEPEPSPETIESMLEQHA